MDKASEKIKEYIDQYSTLLQEVKDMEAALKKVDMDSFHAAHERMMNCLETVELMIHSEEDEEKLQIENY